MPNTRTDWFCQARWGVMAHYLGNPEFPVEAFDVQSLAEQLASTGAGYLLWTIGQNSGHYCSPNDTYDQIIGITPSKCSQRDLITTLAQALEPHGIRLMVYLPSGAPAADAVAAEKLKWTWGYQGDWPKMHRGPTRGERLVEFQCHWEAVIREWSLRWGTPLPLEEKRFESLNYP